MAIEGITATADIFVHVGEAGVAQVFETPGGRGQAASVDVTYRCPWDARYAVFLELLGGGWSQANGLGVPLPGHPYPPSPNLSCESIGRVDPEGINRSEADPVARRWNHPKYCLVPCTYRPLDYAYSIESANDSYQLDPADPILGCRQRIEGNNTFVVVDDATMILVDRKYAEALADPDPAATAAKVEVLQSTDGLPANSVSFTLEYPRVPRNPWAFLRPYLGKVNRFPMWGLDAGQILMAAVTIDLVPSLFGPEISCSLTYLGNLDVGWNDTIDKSGVTRGKVFMKSVDPNAASIALADAKFPFQAADLMAPLRG